jgi:hypothetical protein
MSHLFLGQTVSFAYVPDVLFYGIVVHISLGFMVRRTKVSAKQMHYKQENPTNDKENLLKIWKKG